MGSGCSCQNLTSDNVVSRKVGNFKILIHDIKTSGKGCKKTPAWESECTKEEVIKKIDEFWETRVEGNPLAWKALREACNEPNEMISAQIVTAAGLSMYDGLLMICFDESGKRYDLPPYVINEPLKYGVPKIVQKTSKPAKAEIIQIILRSVACSDLTLNVSSIDTILSVKENFSKHHNVDVGRLRMFFSGKELHNELSLAEYKIQNKTILQVFVSAAS